MTNLYGTLLKSYSGLSGKKKKQGFTKEGSASFSHSSFLRSVQTDIPEI